MPELPVLLQKLHLLHQRIRDLKGEVTKGPQRLNAAKGKIDQANKKLAEAQDAVKHVKVSIHDKEVSIKETQEKITRHQSQMNQVTTKKEYDALRHEIDNERQIIRVLEDQVLEAMVLLDEKTKAVPVCQQLVAQAQQELKKAEEDLGERQKELERKLGGSQTELRQLEEGLPPELKEIYNRLLHSFGPEALAALEGHSCAGCYTEVTPQGYNDLRSGRIVLCKSCGRLLYLPS